MPSKLVAAMANKSKQQMIPATVIDVLGNRCSVRLSGRGTKLTGVAYIGPTPSVGEDVFVDYKNGSPFVYAVSSSLVRTAPPATTAIPASSVTPSQSHPAETVDQQTTAPAGDEGDIQYNNGAGGFAGNNKFHFDEPTTHLYLGDETPPIVLGQMISLVRSDISPAQFFQAIGDTIAGFITFVRARAGETAIQAGDVIGRIRWRSHDGVDYTSTRTEIHAYASENHDADSHGMGLNFQITPNGSIAMVDVFDLSDDGAILDLPLSMVGNKITDGGDPEDPQDFVTLSYLEAFGGGGASDWGDIGGTLSDQTDLQSALDAKLDDSQLDTDGALTANSDTKIASQKAVKTYVDGIVAATDAMVFKGVIDCSANPNYPAADRGHTYRISVAGKIGGASGINVEVGDIIICLDDGTSSGTQAGVGSNWNIIQANIDGAVVGPSSSTDNAIARFDSTTGKIIQNSSITIDDNGNITLPVDAAITFDFSTDLVNPASTQRTFGALTDGNFYHRSNDGTYRRFLTADQSTNILGDEFPDDLRKKLTADKTIYVRTTPVSVAISIASPGVITWNSHGLAADAAVSFRIPRNNAVITVTIASPGVVTWTAHGMAAGDPFIFATTGALPTGITAGTTYFVIATGLTANTFRFAATVGGAAINTSGTQSGVHMGEETGALPTGITVGTIYYVVGASITTNTFEISATPGGASINTSGTQSGKPRASTGSDSNDGSADDVDHALLTPQAAIELAKGYDLGLYDITIQLADGLYPTGVSIIGAWVGAGMVTLKGNTTFPGNVVISTTSVDAIRVEQDAKLTIVDLEFRTTTAGGGIVVFQNSTIYFGNVRFGACATNQMQLTDCCTAQSISNYSIVGSAGVTGSHIVAQLASTIRNQSKTIQLFNLGSGFPSFGQFVGAVNTGTVFANALTFQGSGTGSRYTLGSNGTIFTNGGGANYFPGNSAGTNADGSGVYA